MIREFKEEAGVEIKTWVEFCKLSGKEFEVYFYKATGDLSQVKTMEEEKVEIIDVSNIQNEETIGNLQWLIPLALDTDKIHGLVNYY
jgi:8-oxo-dGTP pyrophosphatase MutT (NUDIX family)